MRIGSEGVIHSFDQSDDVDIIFRHLGGDITRNRRVVSHIDRETEVGGIAVSVRCLHREGQADGIRSRRVVKRAEQIEAVSAMRRRRVQRQREDSVVFTRRALVRHQQLTTIRKRRHHVFQRHAAGRQPLAVRAGDRRNAIGHKRQRPPEGVARAVAARVVVRTPVDIQCNRTDRAGAGNKTVRIGKTVFVYVLCGDVAIQHQNIVLHIDVDFSCVRAELIARSDIESEVECIGPGTAMIERAQQGDGVTAAFHGRIERCNEHPICNDVRVCPDKADQLGEVSRGIRHAREIDEFTFGSQRREARLIFVEGQHRGACGRTEVDAQKTRAGGEAGILRSTAAQVGFAQTGIGERHARDRRAAALLR
ncbi:MAG: hypothetical protein WBB98_07155 [Xanthobacteraceae bacterium]